MGDRIELHVSERLKKLLPPLTKEQYTQLESNVKEDGRLTAPLLYWNDGTQNIIVDGMNRWAIVDGTETPFATVEMDFDSYEEVELWILNHQLGRRNLLKPAVVRKLRGDLYNRLKTQRGGQHPPPHGGAIGQNVPLVTSGGAKTAETGTGTAADTVAKSAGVSPRTVRRDGARATAIDKLTDAAQKIVDKATDKEVKALAALATEDQNVVARAVRTGQDACVADAIKRVKPTKAQTRTKGRQKGKSKQKTTSASLVDSLTKKHIGYIARALTDIAEANGGEGDQFSVADAGLNQLINALREMRKGKQ